MRFSSIVSSGNDTFTTNLYCACDVRDLLHGDVLDRRVKRFETAPVCNYNGSSALGDWKVPKNSTTFILNTGARLIFVKWSCLPRQSLCLIENGPGYAFNSAAETRLLATEVVGLTFTMPEVALDIGLLVAGSLAVEKLLRKAFKDMDVSTIFTKTVA